MVAATEKTHAVAATVALAPRHCRMPHQDDGEDSIGHGHCTHSGCSTGPAAGEGSSSRGEPFRRVAEASDPVRLRTVSAGWRTLGSDVRGGWCRFSRRPSHTGERTPWEEAWSVSFRLHAGPLPLNTMVSQERGDTLRHATWAVYRSAPPWSVLTARWRTGV